MDHIRFDSEVIEQLQNELKKLSEQTEKQKQAVQGIVVGLDQASGADVFVGVENRKGSKNIAISNGTAKTVLGECAKSLQNCSEAEKALAQVLKTVSDMYAENEERIIEHVLSIGDGDPSAHQRIRLVDLTGGKDVPVLLGSKYIASTNQEILSKGEAKDFLNRLLGEGAVGSVFWIWGAKPHEKVEDIFNILTGNTKHMTEEQIQNAKRAFLTATYLRLLVAAEGILSENEKKMHLEILSKHFLLGVKDEATRTILDYMVEGTQSSFDSFLFDLAAFAQKTADGASTGKDIINAFYTATSLIPVAADAESAKMAQGVLAELSKLKGDYGGLEQNSKIPESTKNLSVDMKIEARGEGTNSTHKQYAELIYAIEKSLE